MSQVAKIQFLTPQEFTAGVGAQKSAQVIDVRTGPEFDALHAAGATNIPLDELDRAHLFADPTKPLCFLCKSGQRASKAAQAALAAGMTEVYCITGGTDAWAAAGLPVVRGTSRVISLERQVRIAAGALVLIGAVLGMLVNRWFVGLSAFVGAGLVFAGVTDTCGMGMLLARMPWNKKSPGNCAI